MCVVPSGSTIADEALVGVITCCPLNVESGVTVLGSKAFEVKGRTQTGAQEDAVDESKTYSPTWTVYVYSSSRSRIAACCSDRVETGPLISYQDHHVLSLTPAGTTYASSSASSR